MIWSTKAEEEQAGENRDSRLCMLNSLPKGKQTHNFYQSILGEVPLSFHVEYSLSN